MKRVIIDGKEEEVFYESFPSVAALVRANRKRPYVEGKQETGRNLMERYGCNARFHGVDLYEEAERLANEGFAHPVKAMTASIEKVRLTTRKRYRTTSSPVGYAPIVPNAIKGLPNSMVDSEIMRVPIKVVDVKYVVTFPAFVKVGDAEDAGTKILEAILKLEADGYRVSLDVIVAVYGDGAEVKGIKPVVYMSTNIKHAEQPIDAKKVAFPLCHTAFFRVFGFAWFNSSPHCPDLGSGYGVPYANEFGYERLTQLVRAVENKKNIVVLDIQGVLDSDDVHKTIKEMMKS